jgi:protein-S-isoprenylcysteine O-methyltransferase Ste14
VSSAPKNQFWWETGALAEVGDIQLSDRHARCRRGRRVVQFFTFAGPWLAFHANEGGRTMTFDTRSHEAPTAPKPFHFAPTFKLDLVFSLAYVVLFTLSWARIEHSGLVCGVGAAFGVALVLCYAGKVFIIGVLNQRGGDARTYVISSDLVTSGLYAYSRNPTYALTLVQCLLWSALLLFLEAHAPFAPVTLALTILLPALFFWIHDRVIIPREDAALGAAHPEAFAAYAREVGRWIGRGKFAL